MSSCYSQSPDIFSPIGLAALPLVSPLMPTPVDVPSYPLACFSREQGIPDNIPLQIRLPDSPSVASLASPKAYAVSHEGLESSFHDAILDVRLPDSPSSENEGPSLTVPPQPSLDVGLDDESKVHAVFLSEFTHIYRLRFCNYRAVATASRSGPSYCRRHITRK